jgi:hypothetical protein
MDCVKWEMSEDDMNSFIKNIRKCDAAMALLITSQKIKHNRLLSDLKAIRK